jgi:Spy/CpxP family protein refolding chaperone
MRTFGILILTAGLASAQAPATAEVDALSAQVRALQEQLLAAAKTANQSSGTQQIADLERKLADLRKRYTESHPEVRNAVSELSALRAKIGAQPAQSQAQQDRTRAEQDMLKALQAKVRAELEQKVAQTSLKSSVLPTLPETWWRHEGAAKEVGLTATQIKRMDEIFQQSRLKLIDQKAALDKEEATLEPMVEGDTIDEGRAAAQLDRVAQARAELEKTRGRMLLGIRKQMDMEQWRKLKTMRVVVEKMTLR